LLLRRADRSAKRIGRTDTELAEGIPQLLHAASARPGQIRNSLRNSIE